jgi:hypothetical protein
MNRNYKNSAGEEMTALLICQAPRRPTSLDRGYAVRSRAPDLHREGFLTGGLREAREKSSFG